MRLDGGHHADSTIHLYINPVLWNQGNQITSDVMDIFTENQQITRAEFIGTPMMVSQLDTVHYNQVAGKTMTALFRNNQIYRNDVKGNAQTIYYMQEDEPPEITGMGVIESGDCSFYIEEKQVVKITYRKDPVYTIYPMDKIARTGGGEPAGRSARRKCERDLAVERGLFSYRGGWGRGRAAGSQGRTKVRLLSSSAKSTAVLTSARCE